MATLPPNDSWYAPNYAEAVIIVNYENPGLIKTDDFAFITKVIQKLNTYKGEEGKWGYNGKRGNPNDLSADAIARVNSNVTWGCSIIDVIGGHVHNDPSGNPTPAWIDQTIVTYNAGTVGLFVPIDSDIPVDPSDPTDPTDPENPPVTCQFRDTCKFTAGVSAEEFASLKATVDDTHRLVNEVHAKLYGTGPNTLDDVFQRLDRNLERINATGCRSPFRRGEEE